MTYGGRVGRGAEPHRPQPNGEPRAGFLAELLEEFGLAADMPPDLSRWRKLLSELGGHLEEVRSSRAEIAELERGSSNFENLFRTSPIPMMEQDYTGVEEWMGELRSRGVGHVRQALEGDIEAIRQVVPKIRIVAANPAAVEAVGLSLDDLIGPIDPVIVNEEAADSWLAQLSAVWDRQAVAHASFVAATAAGHKYDAESILSAPIVNGDPDFSRAVFSLIDVTSHRDEERRMAALMEAKNRFLASVSHELRTPLTAILGFARILEDEDELTLDDQRLMVSSVAEHAQEMSNLIEDLLIAARSDMNQLDIIDVKVDLLTEIEQTVRAGGMFTSEVEVNIETSDPYAMGDPTRVRQILRNLLTNAERYGGDHVTVTVSRSNHEVRVDVADDGEGLAGEDWERIFQPYESAHVATGRPGAVGIGLTVSRQLAELMGGTLEYHFEDGQSVFRLQLRSAS